MNIVSMILITIFGFVVIIVGCLVLSLIIAGMSYVFENINNLIMKQKWGFVIEKIKFAFVCGIAILLFIICSYAAGLDIINNCFK